MAPVPEGQQSGPRRCAERSSLRLADGRLLTYRCHGDPSARPLLYCHGFPGSRLEWPLTGAEPLVPRCCVVVPDRPGCGGSDPAPGGGLLAWAQDARQLVDHLGWERFSLLGFSGGAPYALACAAVLGPRAGRIGICSGLASLREPVVFDTLGPGPRAYFTLAATDPSRFSVTVRPLARDPRAFYGQLTGSLAQADRELLARPDLAAHYFAAVRESIRQGATGILQDALNLVGDWGFDPGIIRAPVRLWYGTQDQNTPLAMGRHLAGGLRNGELEVLAGAGHFLLFEHGKTILRQLLD